MSNKFKAKNKFTIIWKIENYYFCLQKCRKEIKSPQFIAENFSGSKWSLGFYPYHGFDQVICVYIYRNDDNAGEIINIDCKLEIFDAFGESLACENINTSFKNGARSTIFIKNQFLKSSKYSVTDTLTVRCYMVRNEPRKTIEYTARTNIGVDRCSFKWYVDNYDCSTFSVSKKILCNDKFQFEINITAPEDEFKINILDICKENEIFDSLTCRIALLNSEGVEDISNTAFFWPEDRNWKFPSFIKKSLLEAEKSKYLNKSGFTLLCEFFVSTGTTTTEVVLDGCESQICVESPLSMDPVNALQEDIRHMYINHLHSDVKLRANDEAFQAHKSVLSARSPVFCAMFDQDMVENQTDIVDISDVDAKTLKVFLEFIYTGIVDDLDYESCSRLLVVADKYQVLSLKEKCSSFLVSAMSDKNVCEILILADMVGDKPLKESAVDFIKGRASAILASEEWEMCARQNLNLATEIFCQLSKDFRKGC